jgi:hypothetical protein
MIGRRGMVVRRRPLLRTAAIGGGAYMAGRASGRSSGQAYGAADDQSQAAGQQPGPAQSAAPGPSAADQLSQLSTLHQQGALSDDEFAAAKTKILGS